MVLDPVYRDMGHLYEMYRRPDEPKRFGDVPLMDIQYYFHDGTLVTISIATQGASCERLSEALWDEYGVKFPRASILNLWNVRFRNPYYAPQNEDIALNWVWIGSYCNLFYRWKHAELAVQ